MLTKEISPTEPKEYVQNYNLQNNIDDKHEFH